MFRTKESNLVSQNLNQSSNNYFSDSTTPVSCFSNRSLFFDSAQIPAIDADSDSDEPPCPPSTITRNDSSHTRLEIPPQSNHYRSMFGPSTLGPLTHSVNLSVPITPFSSSDASSSTSGVSGTSSSMDNYKVGSDDDVRPPDVIATKGSSLVKKVRTRATKDYTNAGSSFLDVELVHRHKKPVSCIIPPETLSKNRQKQSSTKKENIENEVTMSAL